MKVLNLKEMEVVEGGRFLGWGWRTYGEVDTISDSSCGSGYATETTLVYTVFGLETSISKTVVECLPE
jgi:hypothetical protein